MTGWCVIQLIGDIANAFITKRAVYIVSAVVVFKFIYQPTSTQALRADHRQDM